MTREEYDAHTRTADCVRHDMTHLAHPTCRPLLGLALNADATGGFFRTTALVPLRPTQQSIALSQTPPRQSFDLHRIASTVIPSISPNALSPARLTSLRRGAREAPVRDRMQRHASILAFSYSCTHAHAIEANILNNIPLLLLPLPLTHLARKAFCPGRAPRKPASKRSVPVHGLLRLHVPTQRDMVRIKEWGGTCR